ncbi:phage tail tape measure protein [Streptomyces sp. NPDC094032]|uniref:phage tail tape measure protein n=1 Tax=Streptomyces sp. NPDC094032 TaxID=3155308 RepID=UPI003324DE4E
MSDTSLVFNLVARDRTSGELSAMGQRFSAAATTIGAGFAAGLGAGVYTGLDMDATADKLVAQLGLDPAQSQKMGTVAGGLYADAYGDSLETVNIAVGAVATSIKGMTDASASDLEAASEKALNFAKAFDTDVAQSVTYAGTLINARLAGDATEAFDLMTRASQRVPAALRENVLEAADEYGQFFSTLGYSGEQAFGLLVDASAKGQYGIDKAGDAIKEFTILSTDMSTGSQAAYKAIGLDARTMANSILAGGTTAQTATQKIIDGILKIKDPASQASTALALFGTPLEDMNVRDIPAFLKSLKGGSTAMDGFAGSSSKLGETLNGNAAHSLEAFKRSVMLAFADAGGAVASFAMDHKGLTSGLAYTLAGLAVVVLTVAAAQRVYATYTAISTAATNLMNSSTYRAIAGWGRMMAVGLMAYARIAGAAIASAAATAGAWIGSALASIGTWVMAVVRAGITAAAQFAMMAGRAVIWAVTMAAQWLIAMGPIGWVIAAVIGLVALVIANWDTIKAWSGKIWDWIWAKVQGAVRSVLAGVAWLAAIPGKVADWFGRAKEWAIRKLAEMVVWMRGLPGRIGSAVGNLAGLLVDKGKDVARGLWQGIKSMGGWLKDQLMSFARNMVPGPIAKALGIASPSKVTTEQGRWIARGLVVGLMGSAKQVAASAGHLAGIVRSALAPGRGQRAALARIDLGEAALTRLATREVALAARLKAATKSLADQVKARAALAATVRKGVLDAANVTQNVEGPVSASSIWANLTQRLAQARQFAAQLATLRAKGIRSDLIAQVAQAGVEQGSAAATALAAASRSEVQQINRTQADLVAAAGKAGAVAGDAMYGAGIQAARGLVQGLRAQQAAIERQMLTIARTMQSAIKRALGIASPSRVMAALGQWIPAGLMQGIDAGRPELTRTMGALVDAPPAAAALASGRQLAPAAAPLTRGGMAGGVVVVRLETTGADSAVRTLLQKIVRVEGRGSVQVAFGQ